MNTFISHSSKDTSQSVRMEKALEKDAHEVWLDRSDIRLGVLLRDELQSAIRKNHCCCGCEARFRKRTWTTQAYLWLLRSVSTVFCSSFAGIRFSRRSAKLCFNGY